MQKNYAIFDKDKKYLQCILLNDSQEELNLWHNFIIKETSAGANGNNCRFSLNNNDLVCNYIDVELEQAKAIKIEECIKFYESKRYFNVVNGHTVLVKADQDLQNNIQTWINVMKSDIKAGIHTEQTAIYNYAGIIIPFSKVDDLKNYISKIRTYSVANKEYHIGSQVGGVVNGVYEAIIPNKINALKTVKAVNAYNFKVDQDGNDNSNFYFSDFSIYL
jgi:hypothetical protein